MIIKLDFHHFLFIITLLQKFYETGVDDFGFLKHIGEVIQFITDSSGYAGSWRMKAGSGHQDYSVDYDPLVFGILYFLLKFIYHACY